MAIIEGSVRAGATFARSLSIRMPGYDLPPTGSFLMQFRRDKSSAPALVFSSADGSIQVTGWDSTSETVTLALLATSTQTAALAGTLHSNLIYQDGDSVDALDGNFLLRVDDGFSLSESPPAPSYGDISAWEPITDFTGADSATVLELMQRGARGPMPGHEWTGTALALQNIDGTWEDPVELKGEPGSLTQAAVDASAAAVSAAATTAADRTAVASDKSAVAALLSAFRSVFLGSFASDAAAEAFAAANSIAIADGLTYQNTVEDKLRAYTGTVWQDYDSSAQQQQQQAALAAGNAAAAASAAATSATAAGASASAAAGSATSAASALATFRAGWLGAFAADPTQDAGGAALVAGAHGYSTVLQRLKIYVSGVWRAAYNSILALTTSPSSADGVDGDVAIDCLAGNLYGPKSAGAWPAAKSLVGPAAWAPPVDYAAGIAAQASAPATVIRYQGETYVAAPSSGAWVTGATFDASKWFKIAAKGIDGLGGGDMQKSTYDADNDGIVDHAASAASAPWAGITGIPSAFPPSPHGHDATDISGLTTAAVSEAASGLYFTEDRARAVLLTGLNTGASGAVAATDSLITGVSKIAATLSGLKSASTHDAGAAANEVLLIGGDGKLPVVDGSNLTGINAGLSRAEICALALVL